MIACTVCSAPCETGHKFCFACGAELIEHSQVRGDPLIGSILSGGYRVTHLIGVGGMGRVYGAEQVALGRGVAVKVVHPHLANDELATARFLNEARAASRLSHPNSVAIFDFGRTPNGHSYIVMEHLRGRDLARVAIEEGPLPLRRIVDVVRQTLAALEEAHAIGIVHRDLKPDNVMLEPMRSGLDFVKVVDFGLAKVLETEAARCEGRALTQPGVVCGTPEYMSPEHGRGDPLDGRSDLYSVAVMLFELLTGRVPFFSESATKTLLMHLMDPPPNPRDIAPHRDIPPPLAELVVRMLAKSPDDRIQTARAFSEALDKTWGGADVRSAFLVCRACDARNPMGQKFCGECGGAIVGTPLPERGALRSPGSSETARSSARTLERADAVGAGVGALSLIARDEAFAWLEARRHDADAMLSAAHLLGEYGAGKTRLMSQFLALAKARGDVVVHVGPDPSWAKVGDRAVREAIVALAELPKGTVDPAAWKAARPLARQGLEWLFGLSHEAPPGGGERRRAVAEALRWGLEEASGRARGNGLVLAVDDLDFIDGTSSNAFADLLDEPPVVAALVVLAYSPGARPAGSPLPGETFTLQPLPFDSIAEALPKSVVRRVPLLPLHFEQLLAWSRETKDPPPDRLAELLARRVERLASGPRQVLQALSVWGDDADAELLRGLLPSTPNLEEAIETLKRARLIVSEKDTLTVAHPLIRRVVFASLPAGRKRELFARSSELQPDAPLEVRARQAMHGGRSFEALLLLDEVSALRAQGGDIFGSVSALRHALDIARRELERGDIEDPAEAVLLFSRKLAEALAAAEDWTGAEGVLRESLGHAPPTSKHRAHLLGVLARVANERHHPREARRYLDEALLVARQSDARGLMPILEELDKAIAVA